MATKITANLIMNADDYGPSDYINKGIIKGIEHGVINSVSVFVTYGNDPNVKDFEGKLKELMVAIQNAKQKVEVGLHLSLNVGQALTKDINTIPTLLKKKKRKGLRKRKLSPEFKNFYKINITDEYCIQAKIEMHNQLKYLKSFLNQYNKKIDHLNHHVGFVSFHKDLWKAFIEVADCWNLPVRSPLGYMLRSRNYWTNGRVSGVKEEGLKQTLEKLGRNILTFKKHRITESLIKFLRKRKEMMEERFKYANSQGVKMPLSFNDNFYDEATVLKAVNFLQSFNKNEIKEFMLHPSLNTPGVKIDVPQGFQKRSFKFRYLELNVLLDATFTQNNQTIKLSDVIKGKSSILSTDGKKKIKFKLINYTEV